MVELHLPATQSWIEIGQAVREPSLEHGWIAMTILTGCFRNPSTFMNPKIIYIYIYIFFFADERAPSCYLIHMFSLLTGLAWDYVNLSFMYKQTWATTQHIGARTLQRAVKIVKSAQNKNNY
jgi:hypothetical protein